MVPLSWKICPLKGRTTAFSGPEPAAQASLYSSLSGGWFRPLMLAVMRVRSVMIILGAVALLTVALVLRSAVSLPVRPPISIGILSYQPWAGTGPDLMVRVGITNRGFRSIRYTKFNFDGDAWVLTESESGWTKRDIGSTALLPPFDALLESGTDTFAIITLPGGTRRWQIGYTVRTASLRETVSSRISSQWARPIRPLILSLLSKKERWQEVRSAVLECPHNPQRANRGQPSSSEASPTSAAAAPRGSP